jgi:arylsulfatase A-like enzyme
MWNKLLSFLLVLMLAPMPAAQPASFVAPPARSEVLLPPNIVVVLTDDQDLTMGSLAYMPRLRQHLVEQGMSFANFFATQTLCCPSRVNFLRGQYTHNHQVYTNLPPLGGFEKALALNLESDTLATALDNAGYTTGLIGKYLNGYPLSNQQTYIPPGWDEWFVPITNSAYGSYNYTVNDNGVLVSYGQTQADYITDVLASKALDFIRRSASQASNPPFFLFLSFYAPHSPANPARRHIDLFPDAQVPRTPGFNEGDMSDKPSWMQAYPSVTITETQQLDYQYRRRAQSLQAVDEAIEAIVQTLQSAGALDNTYIMFLSDNGYHLGQHRLPTGKGTPYEEDIHLPLVVRGPGVPAGVERNEITAMIDLAPTLVELGGGILGYPADGRSLVSLLHSTGPAANWRQSLLIEYYLDAALHVPDRPANWEPLEPMDVASHSLSQQQAAYTALRTARYIYVERGSPDQELYDLVHDPDQVLNRWREAPAAMQSQLTAFLAPLRTCAAATCQSLDALTPPAYQVPPGQVYLPLLLVR